MQASASYRAAFVACGHCWHAFQRLSCASLKRAPAPTRGGGQQAQHRFDEGDVGQIHAAARAWKRLCDPHLRLGPPTSSPSSPSGETIRRRRHRLLEAADAPRSRATFRARFSQEISRVRELPPHFLCPPSHPLLPSHTLRAWVSRLGVVARWVRIPTQKTRGNFRP